MNRPRRRCYTFGPYTLQSDGARLERAGTAVALPPQALLVLRVLVENSTRVVTKQDLAAAVWEDVTVEDSSIFKNIAVIRRGLSEGLNGVDPIRTISKKGYQFVLPVEVMESAEGEAAPVAPVQAVAAAVEPRRWVRLGLTAAAAVVLAGLGAATWRAMVPRAGTTVRRSVAIARLRNLSDDRSSDWLSTAIAETLTHDVAADGVLRAIPPESVAQARKELSLTPAALQDADIQRLCAAVDCRVAITGSYIPYLEEIRLDLQIRDGVTGRVLSSVSKTGRKDRLFDLVSRVGDEVRHGLGLAPISPGMLREVEATLSPKPEVARLYAEGLNRLSELDAPAAAQILGQAVAAQPDYAPAHAALSSAWTLMGFDGRARDEAKAAMEHRAGLPRQEQLRIEADYYTSLPDWPKAMSKWQALREFYPDDPEFLRKLAIAMTAGGKAKDVADLMRGAGPPASDPGVQLAQAGAFDAVADYTQARQAAAQAIAGARARSLRFLLSRALLAEGRAYFRLSEHAKSLADYQEAQAVSASLGDKAGVARALTYRANDLSARGSGDPEPLLNEALRNAREIGDRRATMLAIEGLANLRRSRADLAGAGKLFEETLALAREVGNPGQEAMTQVSIANILNNTGHMPEARQRYQEGLNKAIEVADRRTQSVAMGNIGILDYAMGDVTGARARLEEVLALKREIGDRSSEAYTLGHLCTVLQILDDLPAARRRVEEQSRILAAIGEKPTGNQIVMAELAVEEGRPEQAAPVLAKIAGESERPSPGSRASRSLAVARLAQGDLRGAREAIDRAVAIAKKSANRADYAIPAAIVEARVATAEGKAARALASLTGALAQARELGHVHLQFEARLAMRRRRRGSIGLRRPSWRRWRGRRRNGDTGWWRGKSGFWRPAANRRRRCGST